MQIYSVIDHYFLLLGLINHILIFSNQLLIIKDQITMTQYLYVDFILSFVGVCLYILGLKKVLFNDPKKLSGLK